MIRIALGRLFQQQCVCRYVSNFPCISTPPPPSNRNHDNSTVNLDLYSCVRAQRDSVWTRDNEISSKPRYTRKLTTLERLRLLGDEGSEVIHIGSLAGGDVVNGSMEVAIVTVCGQLCMVSGNDWTFKGGTIYPIGVKKQLRGQEIALQNNLPCIYIADSGGAFLPLQSGLYADKEHGGRVFRNQAIMSSKGIPQIAVVLGPCTAGGAYIPAMSDEAVIVQDIGTLYIAGPPLVQAATGVQLSAEELGGANVHCSISGCTDHYAHSEEEAMATTRAIVESLPLVEGLRTPTKQGRRIQGPPIEQPLYPGEDSDFARIIPANGFTNWPMMEVLSRIVDGSRLRQFKERYGTGLVTGFARVNGQMVGVLANTGELREQECLKGAHFVRLAALRSLPLVFLVNTASEQELPTASDVVKGRAQLMASIATTRVPKITLLLGGAYGPSYYAMCGRSLSPHFLFHWPHSRCALANPPTLLHTLHTQGYHGDDESYLRHFTSEESTMMTSDLCSDGLILPSETRQIISQCLDITTRYTSHTNTSGTQLNVLRM